LHYQEESLMPPTLESLGIAGMSVEDRLALIEAIWDSIVAEGVESPLSATRRQEIDRRLAAHEADPTAAIPWEQVCAEALARLAS
jgi:putative addiction module component (TIGR02574 family)